MDIAMLNCNLEALSRGGLVEGSPLSVAYFVMEIGLESDIPTYAGGLGVLAGDTAYTFADLGIPSVFVTLLYKAGYTKQKIGPGGQQQDLDFHWQFKEKLTPLPQTVQLEVGSQMMKVKLWQYTVRGERDVPVLFLDTDLPENSPAFRAATDKLYQSVGAERLLQEILLGVGGYLALKALGYAADLYMMNESHAALLIVEMLKEFKSLKEVRRRCMFTTHTPVAGGHDAFPLALVQDMMKKYDWIDWRSEVADGVLNLSKLAYKYSCLTNAVSLKHEYVSKAILMKSDVDHVTNGVYHRRWVGEDMKRLFDRYLPLWSSDPSLLANAYEIPSSELAKAHDAAKGRLISLANASSKAGFTQEPLTIGIAKRITSYKRNGLVLGDPAKLVTICDTVGSLQIVFAGKAHPDDDAGKRDLAQILEQASLVMKRTSKAKVAFMEDYSIDSAKVLVSGCDLWLNNPRRPLEASGTSGMKAAMNGVLNLSTWDGWWLEGGVDRVNGWGIGKRPAWDDLSESDDAEDSKDLYVRLARDVLPLYYSNKEGWLRMCKAAIATVGPRFNTYRMAREYLAKWYARAS
jgi:starch phosphorylase